MPCYGDGATLYLANTSVPINNPTGSSASSGTGSSQAQEQEDEDTVDTSKSLGPVRLNLLARGVAGFAVTVVLSAIVW